ncbi:hypothetical protein GGR52DRAFT_589562 [Hypoxylon sp. FL1284]|nr:hypothetical protein GGR52DRAFT_589562 [Hypoxylon sp. FL1284]
MSLYQPPNNNTTMGPFALPVPSYRLGIHSHKNKRRRTDDGQNGEADELEAEPEWDLPSSSYLPSDSINPRSHSPATLHQLAVAGLAPEDEVPSATHRLFPHKPLPSSSSRRRRRRGADSGKIHDDGDEDGGDGERGPVTSAAAAAATRRYSDRLRHLSTLTAVAHRCLTEGDVARAKRAFGLLIRTRDVDVRLAGLWAIGSEILMRDDNNSGAIIADQQLLQQEAADRHSSPRGHTQNERKKKHYRRWGSAAGADRVRDYFEMLIRQHPHDAHRPHLTSALDFWPALFAVEIYSLDAEFRAALRRSSSTSSGDDDSDDDEEQGQEDTMMAYDEDEDHDGSDGHDSRQQSRKKQAAQAARDDLRLATLDAAERVARRMDQTMESAALGASRALLRLRGGLALYAADLRVPSRLLDLCDEHTTTTAADDKWTSGRVEEHLRARAASADEYAALARRREELERARGFFRKLFDGGGGGGDEEVDGWVREFLFAEDDEGGGQRGAGYDEEW